MKLDVTNENEAHTAVEAAIKRFGRIDILLNNAGYGLLGAVEEANAAEIQKLFATNVFGALSVTRAVLPHMRQQHSGHVINISSIGGYQAYPGWGVYGATKFALEGITEALAAEVGPLGIRYRGRAWVFPHRLSRRPVASQDGFAGRRLSCVGRQYAQRRSRI